MMHWSHQMKPRHSSDTKAGQETHGSTIADQDAIVTPDEAKTFFRHQGRPRDTWQDHTRPRCNGHTIAIQGAHAYNTGDHFQYDAQEEGCIMRVTPTPSKLLAPQECLTCALLEPTAPSVSGGVSGMVVAFS
jgi:hypothetical protein